MKLLARLLVLVVVLAIHLPACHSGEGAHGAKDGKSSSKGGIKMKTYNMGRFSIDVPVEMKQEVQAHTFRLVEIEEFMWPEEQKREEARRQAWAARMSEIKELDPPRGKISVLVDERETTNAGRYAKKVLYYGDFMTDKEIYCDVMLDAGNVGAWLRLHGKSTAVQSMARWLEEVVAAYQPRTGYQVLTRPGAPCFYLKMGMINLPYKRQENTYSRFQGHPLELKLEVEMNETHEVEIVGLAERLSAAIATNFAPGVEVDRIRSRSRTAAGLRGEELVMRMSASGEETQLHFGWEYAGKAESGEHPEIQIIMVALDGNLDAKLKVWDAILDSFTPMYR